MEGDRPEVLRCEVERLRAENDELRGLFRVERAPAEDSRPGTVRVLLTPDPLAPGREGGLGPDAIAGVGRSAVSMLAERTPGVDWRVEHDLRRVPEGSVCHHLGDALMTLWGRGPKVPKAFGVEHDDGGRPFLRRHLVVGEPDSDRFIAGYDRQLEVVEELLREGKAAHDAGAEHHAACAPKAIDVVLARMSVLLATFQADAGDWSQHLTTLRPEYQPRYRVDAELPTGL